MKVFLMNVCWMVSLVLLQVLLFNFMHIAGYGIPLVCLYMMVRFKSDTNNLALLGWGFCTGMLVDMFNNTPGMNAAAMTFVAFMRPTIINMVFSRAYDDVFELDIRTLRPGAFFRYLLFCSILMCVSLYLLEMFSFASIGITIIKILASVVTTTICLYFFCFITSRKGGD